MTQNTDFGEQKGSLRSRNTTGLTQTANFFVMGPLRFGHRIRIRLPHRFPHASNFIRLRKSSNIFLGVLLGVFFPLVSFAASSTYLERNATDFLEKTKEDYGEMINIAALLHDYDKKLIFAVIVVESEGKEKAVSHRGAEGLMQLMPSTAKALGVKDSKEPFQNILGGTKYLKELERSYGFTSQEALVAYNMGPSRAKRWLSQYEPEDFLYVRKVMYVYGLLEAQERQENAKKRFAEVDDAQKGNVLATREARPLMTKPRSLSLAELPLMLSISRRVETESVR